MMKIIPDSERSTIDVDEIYDYRRLSISFSPQKQAAVRNAIGDNFNIFTFINYCIEERELGIFLDDSFRNFSGNSEKYITLKTILTKNFKSREEKTISDLTYEYIKNCLHNSYVLKDGELHVIYEYNDEATRVMYELYKRFKDDIHDVGYYEQFSKKYANEIGDISLVERVGKNE